MPRDEPVDLLTDASRFQTGMSSRSGIKGASDLSSSLVFTMSLVRFITSCKEATNEL